MNLLHKIEEVFLKKSAGLLSRVRILFFLGLGLKIGSKNRMESGRCRRLQLIKIGSNNAFTKGYMLWPEDIESDHVKIKIGNNNYFNRNLMVDACNEIEIGNYNMFGPDVYITDSNHQFSSSKNPSSLPMTKGIVRIGNGCWIGAKVCILKDVTLGNYCVVAAGAVVTKSFPDGSLVGGVPAKLLRKI